MQPFPEAIAHHPGVLGVHEWLGPRLSMALRLLGGPWPSVADVACDHARLALGAIASGQAQSVVASDLAADALSAGAKRAFAMVSREDEVGAAWRRALGLSLPPACPDVWPKRFGEGLKLGPLQWLVSPALAHLPAHGVQAIAMCGIGAQLAVRLLEQAHSKGHLQGVQRVVLLPHWSTAEALDWARKHGWALVGEEQLLVKGRSYPGLAFDAPRAAF